MPLTLAIGDLHLVRESPPGLVADLTRLLELHPGSRLVVVGDLFDLSAAFPKTERPVALRSAFAEQPLLRAALARHLGGGGELWLLGGNHDAAVGDPDCRDIVLDALGATGDAARRVVTSPWFIRDGDVHYEHGHLYDPDNASPHPLSAETRCLGVHFVEEFIAPTGAHRYLNSNDDTPLKLFVRAFTWYGFRGPYVVLRYFQAAFAALGRSGPFFDGVRDEARGRGMEAAFAASQGVSTEEVRALVGLGAAPTMTSLGKTFTRLYMDRVIGTISLAGGLGALARRRYVTAALALGFGGAIMTTSWALGYDRYGGTVPEHLVASGERLAEITGSRLVVFGHAHREHLGERYANTGSFAFFRDAPGRPYLVIEAGRAERRYLEPSSGS